MTGIRETVKNFFEKLFPEMTGQIRTADNLIGALYRLLPFSPETVKVLSYKDVIEYFVKERPSDPLIVKGAMMILAEHENTFFIQVFLDKNNKPLGKDQKSLYGRRLIFEAMDDELKATFGESDLVIVE